MAIDSIPEDRAARNQSLFREHNEYLERFNASSNLGSPALADWVCECASEACEIAVQLTVAEYEAVRSGATHFIVAPGEEHVVPEVERVVEREERYWVVEKTGHAGELSERFDPRARSVEVELHEVERAAWNLPEARPSS